MADRDPEEKPSLELPSLGGWRRRRRSHQAGSDEPPPTPTGGDLRSVHAPQTEPDPPPAPAPPAEPPAEPPLTPTGGDLRSVRAPRTEPNPPPAGGSPTAVLSEPAAELPAEARRRRLRERGPGGLPTVLVVGLLVGLAVVGLTWASLQTCEQVQGTPSCGRAGYPMLALVLVLSVVVGAVLLRLARVTDPASTSFLGTGLAAVIALLFLVDQLDRPAMVVVIPVISALTFAAAHWVTATFIEPGGRDQAR